MNRVLFPLPSFFGSVMPLPVVCRRLLRVLRSVYIWQYDTSTVAELLTVVSHSHLIFFKKNSLLTSRLFVTNSIRSVYSLSLLKLPRREFIRLLAFVVFPDSANQHRIRPVITFEKVQLVPSSIWDWNEHSCAILWVSNDKPFPFSVLPS